MSYEVSQRVPRNAFLPSPIFIGLVALTGVSAWMTWTGFGNVRVDVFLLVICGWLVSLCLHEYAHALVAYFSGDRGERHDPDEDRARHERVPRNAPGGLVPGHSAGCRLIL